MPLSDTFQNLVLGKLLTQTDFVSPTGVFIALSRSDPLQDFSGIDEVTESGAVRVPIICSSAQWNNTATGLLNNNLEIVYPSAGGSWGLITHAAAFNHITAGTGLFYFALSVPKSIALDEQPKFSIGDFNVILT